MDPKNQKHTLAENKKALFDYEILEEYEAGIKLLGEEVKSVRNGSINLRGSYLLFQNGGAVVVGIHISEYRGGVRKLDPKREREILLKKKEILRLEIKIKEIGGTVVPISIYSKGNLLKLRIALVKGKKTWQKKDAIKARDLEREMRTKFR